MSFKFDARSRKELRCSLNNKSIIFINSLRKLLYNALYLSLDLRVFANFSLVNIVKLLALNDLNTCLQDRLVLLNN